MSGIKPFLVSLHLNDCVSGYSHQYALIYIISSACKAVLSVNGLIVRIKANWTCLTMPKEIPIIRTGAEFTNFQSAPVVNIAKFERRERNIGLDQDD